VSRFFSTPERTAARERLDSAIRELVALIPNSDDEVEFTGQPLLSGWVLLLDWIDDEGDSVTGICPSPGLGYATQRGLLSIGLENH